MKTSIRRTRRDVIELKHLHCASSFDIPDLSDFQPPPRLSMIQMKEIPTSSNLAAAGYCPVDRVFAVRFKNGKVYHHKDVPQDLAAGFNDAESKGSFYAREIKPNHPGELLVEAEQQQ